MSWYRGIAILALAICLGICIFHIIRLLKLGKPRDYSKQAGNISKALIYSYTGAMSPVKKESAFLHLPTYTAGIFYHLGTFLSLLIFIFFIFNTKIEGSLVWIISGFLFITGLCGIGILLKRMIKKELLALSNPDDFISNILVTVFQFVTAFTLIITLTYSWLFYSDRCPLVVPAGGKTEAYSVFFCSTLSYRIFFWMARRLAA